MWNYFLHDPDFMSVRFYIKANNGKFYTVVSELGIRNLVKQVWLKFGFYSYVYLSALSQRKCKVGSAITWYSSSNIKY